MLGLVATGNAAAASQAREVRFATFNASLNRGFAGELILGLATPGDPEARAVAEIIQRVDPDVLLINELDLDAGGVALELFQQNHLFGQPERLGAGRLSPRVPRSLEYRPRIGPGPRRRWRDRAGPEGYGGDALGFGNFAGQFGLALLSRFPIDQAGARRFQRFLWRDMPGALLPVSPATGEPWYAAEELAVLRLSAKAHVDVPIDIDGVVVHVLASHPTPPTFDGDEDRNGRRNHDETRFWADYVRPSNGGYLVDDDGRVGGLGAGERFVIMGDQNADPFDGDSVAHAVRQLLDPQIVDTARAPSSPGGVKAAASQGGANQAHKGDPAADTADFGDDPARGGFGNLRVDYVLPSRGLEIRAAQVFWPPADDPSAALLAASDHRLVWVDVMLAE